MRLQRVETLKKRYQETIDTDVTAVYVRKGDQKEPNKTEDKLQMKPIRHMTILKLELHAAVYGVRLRKQILSKNDVRIDKIYHWTDPSTVQHWLQAAYKKEQL